MLSTFVCIASFQAGFYRQKRFTSVDQKEKIETSNELFR
ncbi:MAG: hypothetical protein ANABAC_2424 [Anaerolineae bacterium]|nr:MAG: hypothetical protein ANABAC_2424 [Anaerolineae bacterium]